METTTSNGSGGLTRLRELVVLAKDLGMPWAITVLVILLATGVLPSQLYSKVEALDQYLKEFAIHKDQTRDIAPLLRAICRNVAKTESSRGDCDRSFTRGE